MKCQYHFLSHANDILLVYRCIQINSLIVTHMGIIHLVRCKIFGKTFLLMRNVCFSENFANVINE